MMQPAVGESTARMLSRVCRIWFGIVVLFCYTHAQTIISRDSLIKQYQFVEHYIGIKSLDKDTVFNATGFYAWNMSDFLRSEMLMYQATKDTEYLFNTIHIADIILANRDDHRGIKDWDGESKPGWSSSRRWDPKQGKTSNGLPNIRDLMQDACIVYPYLLFADVVLSDSAALSGFVPVARKYLTESELVLRTHIETEWDDDLHQFRFPKGSPIWVDGVNVPHNYEAQVGSDLFLLNRWVHNSQYAGIIRWTAADLKNDLTLDGDAYVWYYYGGLGHRGWKKEQNVSVNTPEFKGHNTIEDISHGDNDVAFMIDCYDHDIVFDKTDMMRLVNTFTMNINKYTYLSHDVKGSADSVAGMDYHGPYYWMELSRFNKDVYTVMYDICYANRHLRPNIPAANLVSRLIFYYPDIR